MTSRWIRRLLRAWPRRAQTPKRAEMCVDLPETPPRFDSGRGNFRAPADAAPLASGSR